MKRLFLIVISLILALSLMSCDLQGMIDGIVNDLMPSQSQSSDDDYEGNEEEDDEDDEEEENEDSEQESVADSQKPSATPTYGEDETVYSNETSEDGTTWTYGSFTLKAPSFTNYYNGYSSALSMTFDDGYDYNTGYYVNSIFEQYGFRGTAMLGPCFLNESAITEWNKILAEGYLDVGCHGYDHVEPTELAASGYEHEIKDAIEFLKTNFPGQRVLTFATPFAHINDSYETYLKDYCISNRLELGGEAATVESDFNMYRVKSYSFNKSAAIDSFNSSISNKLKQNGAWVVELIHCVLDSPYNSTDLSKANFANHCEYIYNNYKDTVWVASYEDVAIYLNQVKTAKINYTASDRESMSLNITCDLDKDIYNIPMTIKVRIPACVTSAYAVIDGEEQDLTVVRGSGMNVVTVKNIPVNGSDVKIYFGGNDSYDNGCAHIYKDTNVSATCQERGYTLYECTICDASYKSAFTQRLEHDFSGERTTEKEATLSENGIDILECLSCGSGIEIETKLENLAKNATMTTSDGKNEWVYASDMVDGSVDTAWINGTDTPEIQMSFAKSTVNYVEITLSRFSSEWIQNGTNQKFIISVYDGAEWTEIGYWSDAEETSEDSPITVKFEINKEITDVKILFEESATGCTSIKEITVISKKDLQ